MAEICVAHLVREGNGIAPFERFLTSYRANLGGVPHDLVIVLKGFRGERVDDACAALLGDLPHERLFVPDEGFDIGAWFRVAEARENAYLCFLNSFSRLRDDRWLEKMADHVRRPGVGIVGATGSWESLTTNATRTGPGRVPVIGRVRGRLVAARLAKHFAPFPNAHVRTNGFLIARDTMLRLRRSPIRTKSEAHRFESGLDGMSRQVLAAGMRLVLAGRDGRGYEQADWHRSGTFRQAHQENLLVADNQTDAYDSAGVAEREKLGRLAWGDAWSA